MGSINAGGSGSYFADQYGSVNGGRDTDVSGVKVCLLVYLSLWGCIYLTGSVFISV